MISDDLALPLAQVSGFGHLGDGNLHLNIHTPGVFEKREDVQADPLVGLSYPSPADLS